MFINLSEWHKRRKLEKLREIEVRKEKIFQDPINLNLNGLSTLPWQGLNVKEFNEKWAYKPVQLYGYYDQSKEIYVEKYRRG